MSASSHESDVNGDPSDAESASSSVVYDHEPFETFRARVLDFTLNLWKELSEDQVRIEKLSGGGFNRIVGISKAASEEGTREEYILRIPRFDAARLDRDVAALYYVQQLGDIPVPRVISFDETSDNQLGSPYMIQTRLPGTSLQSAFPTMDQRSKCQLATELGRVYRRMLSAKSEVPGLFCLSSQSGKDTKNLARVDIAPLFETDADVEVGDLQNTMSRIAVARRTSSTLGLFQAVFNARKADGKKYIPKDSLRPGLWNRFIGMALEMDAEGWFAKTAFTLCHLDLAPRNILVDHTRNGLHAQITGILDWDSAALAPSFMTCAPPLWIWAWNDDEDEDERTANDTPPTDEGKALKQAFEDAAGAEYVQYAYPPAYRLARRLVRFAISGIQTSEDLKEAESMLREWNEVRKVIRDHVDIKEADQPYLVIKTLGKGGSCTVEEVRNLNSGLVYARKLFYSMDGKHNMNEMFENERKIMRSLKNHRHIVDLIATDTTQKRLLALIMSPVADEGDLSQFLDELSSYHADPIMHRERIVAMSQVLRQAFGCLALGLKYMHANQIRLSDVKPQNILVHQGRILYTDFGVSLDFSMLSDDVTYGPHAKARRYAAPEVLEDVSMSLSSDVFSLGCIFIEMVTALGMTIEHERKGTYAESMKEIHEQLLVRRPSIGSFLPGVIIMMTLFGPRTRWTAEKVSQECLVQSGFTCNECYEHNIEKDHIPFNPWQDCMDIQYLTTAVDGR
jgi:serine/threonine protein kinase/aminoglycoside phosphotransferase (APT) family kinase protein